MPPLSLCVYPPIVPSKRARQKRYRDNEHTQQQKKCWRRRFLCSQCHIKESGHYFFPELIALLSDSESGSFSRIILDSPAPSLFLLRVEGRTPHKLILFRGFLNDHFCVVELMSIVKIQKSNVIFYSSVSQNPITCDYY
jgi:hypothetical protein